ncbi:PRTRC system protein C [Bacillus atrophaeus]|uniref:PRTRC system protein C n=1 Tax=Bacillus atrophaeus TaxID=1452 RepID=UPI001C10364C|nr:PRTRC system protein C [Bacillus atrophaeus]MBU5262036.1 PRTRC system protein C [Bacillus atrophaeus]
MALEFEKEQNQEQIQEFGTRLEQEEPKQPNNSEEEQLALFDEPKQEQEKPKAKKPATKKQKAKPEEKVGTDYVVYYAGNRIPVPEDNMTLEEVRAYLEADFPELSKERTQMLLEKKEKQVVPVVSGAKKG